MVKLDVSLLRFLDADDFRVLTALEMAMRNHDVAPTVLIERIAQLPHGGCRKRLQHMLKHKLIHHDNTAYDGYALKYGAYDYLALRTLAKRGTCVSVGHRIGCGKESDIVLVRDEAGSECVLKLQRLGRCSFRSVTRNRDYKGGGRPRHGESWFYLSRLAAQKEFAFMKLLHDEGFPVPRPIDHNRHVIVMEHVSGTLLNNIVALGDAARVYRRCLELMVRLAEAGLVHGDFNEFNLFVTEEQRVVVIDFPQMVSTSHRNAGELFDRDVRNLAAFFRRRFAVDTQWLPTLADDVMRTSDLDRRVFASGCFSVKQQKELDALMTQQEQHDEDDSNDDEDATDEAVVQNEGVAVDDDDGSADKAQTRILAQHHDDKDDKDDAKQPQASHEDMAGDDDGDDARSSASDDTTAAEVAARRLAQHDDAAAAAVATTSNANVLPDGRINEAHVRSMVRSDLRRRSNRDFNASMHRNVQKGRQKMRIQRQIKSAFGKDLFD